MQDYNYLNYGCSELTIEISCCKYPAESQIKEIWEENKRSLVEYVKLANIGVRGVVVFKNSQPAAYIIVKIDGREPYFKTNLNGEFYRLLLPGRYTLTLMLDCEGHVLFEHEFNITNEKSLVELNLTLDTGLFEIYSEFRLQTNQTDKLNARVAFCSNTSVYTCNEVSTTIFDFVLDSFDRFITKIAVKIPKRFFDVLILFSSLFLLVNIFRFFLSFLK